MELPSPDEYARERPRKPHWKKSSFWKMFGTMLVIYLVLRILITVDWSSGPAEAELGSEPEPSSPTAAPTDQPEPAIPSE
ncbi:MAG: hypothetical protein MK082_03435 [Phycisphaerales bacterium]|nr:hypothetical protein [Phycisphaerales bacterium]